MTLDGAIFVKEAWDAGSLHMLRREAVVYRQVKGPFLPAYVGFADRDDRALLALEHLEEAHWPPPYPDDVGRLFEALGLVASTNPPADIPRHEPWRSRWNEIGADPMPFLSLGLCTPDWLDRSLGALAEAESQADFRGEALVHNDVYSGNVAFTARGAVLVDWGTAVQGSPWIDIAFALLSIRVEGGETPEVDFPGEHAFASALAGHLAAEAPAPLPAWADPDSSLRQDMAEDLAHALPWAASLLDLPPPR